MDNRKKGIISLVVMVALTVALIFGSDSIYQALYHEPGAGGIQTAAPGFAGDVVVSTTIGSDGTIEDVTVVDVSTETPELGQAAAPEVAAAIVEQQSLAVDGVSGATMTSNAIKNAVFAAITEAGFDPVDYGASEVAAAEPAEEETSAEMAESGEETVTEVVETEAGAETAETEAAAEAAETETEAAAEAAPAGEATGLAAGEYEASAAGFGGDVKVSVLVGEAGDIQGVRILDVSTETPDVGQKAAPEIAKAIVMNQSTDVDVVSGATMTSNAVMEAAALALSGEGTPVEAAAPAASDEAAEEPAEEETAAEAAESGEETVTEVVETEAPAETEAAETETEAAAEAAPAGESSGLAAGEYEASAAGFGGDVKVSVAIAEDGSIQSVKLLDISSETPDVGQQAAPEIARAIVVNQTTDVDVVSGATMTSNAVMEAAALALSGEGTPVEGDAGGFGEETVAVIGGADGPTSVFVAGKTEDEESTEEETAEEATEAAAETEAADGGVFGTTEYVASAQGYAGEVKVAVVLGSDGVIYDVKILDCSAETEDKGQVVAPQIAQAIVLANSTDVDTVSGATLTSNAVIEAVNSAIASK